ncbi:MAG: FkbM family methyltransferase [Pirellulales bacterium]
MITILDHSIPEWLYKEVDQYFIPLSFQPVSVLDIGANIGAFAQRAHAKWPAAKIFCYEPMPFNVTRLRRNVPESTAIISAAVREKNGLDEIFIGDNLATSGFRQLGRQSQQKMLVECVAASELPSCDIVKIDTEGCEVEILQTLPLKMTKAIFLEYHTREDSQSIKAILASEFSLVSEDSLQDLGMLLFVRK